MDGSLAAFLLARQTSRFAYGEEPLSAAAIQRVEALTDFRTTLSVTTDPEVVQAVLALNNEILLDDLQDRGTSQELDTWIRYTER